MSIWKTIKNIAKPVVGLLPGGGTINSVWDTISDLSGPVGAGLGAMSQSSANNRGAQAEAALGVESLNQGRDRLRQGDDSNAIGANNSNIAAGNLNRQAYDDFQRQMVAREQEGREGRRSAMKDLQIANYVQGADGQKPVVTTSGKTLNTMGLGARASTDQEKAGMAAAAKEIMARLEGGNPIEAPERQAGMPTNFQVPSAGAPRMYDQSFSLDPSIMKPGTWEKISGVLGPVATAYGAQEVSKKRPVPVDDDIYRPAQ